MENKSQSKTKNPPEMPNEIIYNPPRGYHPTIVAYTNTIIHIGIYQELDIIILLLEAVDRIKCSLICINKLLG